MAQIAAQREVVDPAAGRSSRHGQPQKAPGSAKVDAGPINDARTPVANRDGPATGIAQVEKILDTWSSKSLPSICRMGETGLVGNEIGTAESAWDGIASPWAQTSS
jgi:hypothetical protein